MEAIMGEEVVVTAMMRGQTAAINQQVNSNTIVNVVSKEKIMELPDQNAAETVARLPGVSLVRDGGEGTKVTLRGMAPRFNSITIDGEKVPSTSDQDRSVDLSMFSTDALVRDRVLQGPASRYGRGCHRGTDQFHFQDRLRRLSWECKGADRLQPSLKSFGQYKGSVIFENRFFNDQVRDYCGWRPSEG